MGDSPPPPPGSRIQVEVSGDTLRVLVPGRWTTWFWLSLLFCLFFISFAFGMNHVFEMENERRKAAPALLKYSSYFMPLWGVLCFIWFFFVFKARRETLTFDRERLETRGSFRPFVAKTMKTELIRGFVRKRCTLEHHFQGTVPFEGLMGHKMLLFATALEEDLAPREASIFPGGNPFRSLSCLGKTWATRDLALAVQADTAELEWLRVVLESHRVKLCSPSTAT